MKKYEAPIVEVEIFTVGDVMDGMSGEEEIQLPENMIPIF